jgi:hypothetical protein
MVIGHSKKVEGYCRSRTEQKIDFSERRSMGKKSSYGHADQEPDKSSIYENSGQ